MKRDTLLASSVIAVLMGIIQAQVFITGWSYINLYRYGLIGHANVRLELWASVVLAMPVAFVLLKLRPEKLWVYLVLAIVPVLIMLNLDLVGGALIRPEFAGSSSLGWLPEIYALPAAAGLLRSLMKRAPKDPDPDGLAIEQRRINPVVTTSQRDTGSLFADSSPLVWQRLRKFVATPDGWIVLLAAVAATGYFAYKGGLFGPHYTDEPSIPAAEWNKYLADAARADTIADPQQRCLAYPDLPGNHWPAGSAKGRCGLFQIQNPPLSRIAATLAAPDGAAQLDREYAQLLAAHYRDPAHGEVLFDAYQDFGTANGQRLAALWLEKSPQSAFAMMAKGRAAFATAGTARGTDFIDKTSNKQINGMDAQLAIAVPLLKAALAKEPRLSPACVDLMQASAMVGDGNGHAEAAKHCMAVDPLSWYVNEAWMRGYDPRWGGSFGAMDRAIDEIRTRVPANPALGALLAKSIGLRVFLGRDWNSDLTGIAKVLDHAAVTAPDPFYIGQAGIAAKQAKNNPKALAYLSQALRFAPNYSLFLVERGELRKTMGDRAGALADLHRAMALVNDDCDCRDDNRIMQLLIGFESLEEKRMAFRSEIKSPEQHEWASYRLCETYINDAYDPEGALACTKKLTDEFPNSAEALFMRSAVLYIQHEPGAAEVAARFHQVVDPSDERQQQMITELARLSSSRASSSREWEPRAPSPR